MNGVWARGEALAQAARAGLLVLDVDGVLLDPRPSFYAAAREVSAWAAARALGRSPGPLVTDDEIAAFKSIGGWNDDFELACGCAWALVAREAAAERRPVSVSAIRSSGGGLPALLSEMRLALPSSVLEDALLACAPTLVRDRCAARYAGLDRCLPMYGIDHAAHADLPADGLWSVEPALADAFILRAAGLDLALFTGRNVAEAQLALERFDLLVPAERCAVDDGRIPRKPAPDGLLALARFSNGRALVFIGDSIDDQRAALAYRAHASADGLPAIIFVRVLGRDATEADHAAAIDAGADVVTAGLDDFLRALPPRDRRDDP